MHGYAKKIGEHIKENYCPSNMNREELRELGEWTDIMKDLMEFDMNKHIVEAMEKEEHTPMMKNYAMGYHEMNKMSTHDGYKEALHKYMTTKSEADKETMQKHMHKYLNEIMDSFNEIWSNADVTDKATIKSKFAEMYNNMK